MPRLKCTFAELIKILEANGFREIRHKATSHRRFRGEHSGSVWLVTVAYHRITDQILPQTLASIIRQSGLSKALFRK